MIRRPPRSTLFPTRRSSDLGWLVFGRITAEATCKANAFELAVEKVAEPIVSVAAGLTSSWANVALLALERSTDRKSTRLNSSHTVISYAVFCLKKKKKQNKNKTSTEHNEVTKPQTPYSMNDTYENAHPAYTLNHLAHKR